MVGFMFSWEGITLAMEVFPDADFLLIEADPAHTEDLRRTGVG